MKNINKLNTKFAFDNESGTLKFKNYHKQSNYIIVEIENAHASASIALQGAHLLRWSPVSNNHKDDIIWLSRNAVFAEAKSVRGGIPVCWPWFGAHPEQKDFPAHGFARTQSWRVKAVNILPGGETELLFCLLPEYLPESVKAMWPYKTPLEYSLKIGKNLQLQLTTFNHDKQALYISQALHSYFNIGDISAVTVYGLEAREYLDKADNFNRKKQTGPLIIDSEVDRIYLNTADDVLIDNLKRKIIIRKQGSHSTVVWNPWKKVAEKMGDMGLNGYAQMLCVESANAAEDRVKILPGESHSLKVCYEIEDMG